jgi:hypothetical protein
MQLFIHHLSQTLTTLNVYNNQIGDQGAEHLANALQQNKVTSLRQLHFLCNYSFIIYHRRSRHLSSITTKSVRISDDVSMKYSRGMRHRTTDDMCRVLNVEHISSCSGESFIFLCWISSIFAGWWHYISEFFLLLCTIPNRSCHLWSSSKETSSCFMKIRRYCGIDHSIDVQSNFW